MAGEFAYAPNQPGLALVARVYDSVGNQVGVDLPVVENGPLYLADMPAAPEGLYSVLFFLNNVQHSNLETVDWDGTQIRLANTVAPDNASIADILTDTNDLQTNQGDWVTATGFSTHGVESVVTAMQSVSDDFKADISNVSTFDPAVDVVANVALVDVTTANTDMRGTDDALLDATYNPVDLSAVATQASVDAIPTNPVLVTDTRLDNLDAPISNANTVAPDNASIADILADTNNLQSNQGDWATATGFSTHNEADVVTAMQAVASDFTADLSNVSTFDPAVDVVANVALVDVTTANTDMRGTDDALLDATYSPVDLSAVATQASVDAIPTNPVLVTDTRLDNLDAPVSGGSGLTLAQVETAIDNAFVAFDPATKAELDTSEAAVIAAIPSTADIEAALLNEGDGQALIDAIVTLINTNLDLPALELAAIASQVRTELSTELSRLDVPVSTRSSHTTPDLSAVATQASVDAIPTNPVLVTDTRLDNLDAPVSGANTVAPDNTSIADILADTAELQTNQGDWTTATGFSTHNETDVVSAMQLVSDDFKADVTSLSTFDPAVDVVANVALVDVTTANTDMRGTDDALLDATYSPVDLSAVATQASVDAIPTNPVLVTDTRLDNLDAPVSGANTVAPDNASIADILVDTSELQTNQGDWTTATGFSTHNEADVVSAMQLVSDDFKADVTSLSTFDPAVDVVANVALVDVTTANTDMRGTDDALLDATYSPVDLSAVATQASVDAIPTNPVLVTDTRLDNLDAPVSGANTVAPDNASIGSTLTLLAGVSSNVENILVDTNELQTNQGDWLTYDASFLFDELTAITANIDNLNDVSTTDIWQAASRTLTDFSGFEFSNSQVTRIAEGVELALLDENDGRAILNAIVGAIGNTNIDQVALVAAIRADLERPNGAINSIAVGSGSGNVDLSGLETSAAAAIRATTIIDSIKGSAERDLTETYTLVDSILTLGARQASVDTLTQSVADLNDFNPDTDVVANVALVDTTTENLDMRGTDDALLSAAYEAPDNAAISEILLDTSNLQSNQGDWVTATGFSTHNEADVVTAMQAVASDFTADLSNGVNVTEVLGVSLNSIDDFKYNPEDFVIEGTESHADSLRIMRAESAGQTVINGSQIEFMSSDGTKPRITSTTDLNGQRLTVNTDGE